MDEEHVFRHVLFLYDENTQIQIHWKCNATT